MKVRTAALLCLLAAACGGGSGTETPEAASEDRPEPACARNGASITIVGLANAFDTPCLSVPAGEPVSITLENKDAAIMHNVAVYRSEAATDVLYRSETFTGPATKTFEVPALEKGTYVFRCDVHPTEMSGTFVVA